jgi:hypothetical protein
VGELVFVLVVTVVAALALIRSLTGGAFGVASTRVGPTADRPLKQTEASDG